MSHTRLNGGFEPLDSQVSRRYDEGGEELTVMPRQSADWAGGGAVSSAADLCVFLRALVEGKLFKRAGTHEVMRRWRSTKGHGDKGMAYGMGLFLVNYQDEGLGRGYNS